MGNWWANLLQVYSLRGKDFFIPRVWRGEWQRHGLHHMARCCRTSSRMSGGKASRNSRLISVDPWAVEGD